MSSQSPIKLTADTALRLKRPKELLKIAYKPGAYPGEFSGDRTHGNFVLTGPFPKIRFRKRGAPNPNWRTYKLVRVHIHKPAEHLVEQDTPANFEVHFLHVPKKGTVDDPKVVIAVLFSVAENAPARAGLDAFARFLPSQQQMHSYQTGEACPHHEINPYDFFPIDSCSGAVDLVNWFSYEGSLTSYPYSEDVTWFVMKNQSLISPADAEPLERHAEQDARPLQPLDRRIVVRSF